MGIFDIFRSRTDRDGREEDKVEDMPTPVIKKPLSVTDFFKEVEGLESCLGVKESYENAQDKGLKPSYTTNENRVPHFLPHLIESEMDVRYSVEMFPCAAVFDDYVIFATPDEVRVGKNQRAAAHLLKQFKMKEESTPTIPKQVGDVVVALMRSNTDPEIIHECLGGTVPARLAEIKLDGHKDLLEETDWPGARYFTQTSILPSKAFKYSGGWEGHNAKLVRKATKTLTMKIDPGCIKPLVFMEMERALQRGVNTELILTLKKPGQEPIIVEYKEGEDVIGGMGYITSSGSGEVFTDHPPCVINSVEAAEYFSGLGQHHHGINRAAIQVCRYAAERNPDNAQVHFRLGQCHHKAGDYEGAVGALEKALSCDGISTENEAVIHNNLAYFQNKTGKMEAAIENAHKAMESDRGACPHINLATAHTILGEFPSARKAYKQAVRLGDKDAPRSLEMLAVLESRLG